MGEHVQVIGRIEPEIKAALEGIKESEGIMLEWQFRMGLLLWLESKGIDPFAKPTKISSRTTGK